MNTYYTIISAVIRPEINEKISLGLLAVSGNEAFLNLSKSKLSITRALLPQHIFNGLKDEIRDIQIAYRNFKEKAKENVLFDNPYKGLIEESYISYLSKYKNNVVIFSKPQKIDIQLTPNIVTSLYHKFVDEEHFTLEENHYENSIEKYRKEYLPNLSSYYNTNRIIDRKTIPDVIIPMKFDLVGKNEIEVFAKSIDLERRTYNVEHDVNGFYPLKNLKEKAKKFFISKEPDKKYETQHQIWQTLRSANWLEYVDISEVERLEKYAKEHQVLPLFPNE